MYVWFFLYLTTSTQNTAPAGYTRRYDWQRHVTGHRVWNSFKWIAVVLLSLSRQPFLTVAFFQHTKFPVLQGPTTVLRSWTSKGVFSFWLPSQLMKFDSSYFSSDNANWVQSGEQSGNSTVRCFLLETAAVFRLRERHVAWRRLNAVTQAHLAVSVQNLNNGVYSL